MCRNSLGSHRLVWPAPVCEGKQKGRAEPRITESKDFVFAGVHNVSSVIVCDPSLKHFFTKCFEDNPVEKETFTGF